MIDFHCTTFLNHFFNFINKDNMKILTDSGLVVLWKKIKDLYQKTTVTAKQTTTSTADGGTNVMTFTFGDGTSSTLSVQNGSKGSNGAQGAKGEKGDKGDTGLQGAQGERGPVGATGPQGNSGITDASNKKLINDTITGGETDYLSAEMGKMGILIYDCSNRGTVKSNSLQDAINSVPATFQKGGLTIFFRNINDQMESYTLNLAYWSPNSSNWVSNDNIGENCTSYTNEEISKILAIPGIYTADGLYTADVDYYFKSSTFIYAKAFKTIVVKNQNAQNNLGVYFLNKNKDVTSHVLFDGTTQIIKIPTDCTYFRISAKSPTYSVEDSLQYLKLIPANNIVTNYVVDLEFPDRSVYQGYVDLEPFSRNPFIQLDSDFITSKWIDVTKCDAISIDKYTDSQKNIGLDIRDKFLIPVVNFGIPHYYATENHPYSFELPPNSAFLRISIKKTLKDSFKFSLRRKKADYVDTDSSAYYNSGFEALTWCALGDSLTAINGGEGNGVAEIEGLDTQAAGYITKGYITALCDKLKLLHPLNCGRSSATTLVGCTTETIPQADIYSIMYGISDFTSEKLVIGTDTDFVTGMTKGTYTDLNYRQNIGAIIYRIKNVNPNARIIVMFPTFKSSISINRINLDVSFYNDLHVSGKFTFSDLRDGIQESCSKHNIPFINLLDDDYAPFFGLKWVRVKNGDSFKYVHIKDASKYFKDGQILDYEAITNDCTWMTYDGLHPSNIGFQQYAEKMLPVFKATIVDCLT